VSDQKQKEKQSVVLVHGIWMTGLEMGWLGRRLGAMGYSVHYFHYQSFSTRPRESAEKLNDFVKQLQLEQVHFVGHSLGGIILLHLFDLYPGQPPGRVVLLGSPVLGSLVARTLSFYPLLHHLLGRTTDQGLLGDAPAWRRSRPLGVIAGNSGMGIGRFFGCLDGPCDGTVAVAETRLAGADDFCTLPVGHMGMLFSREVAKQTEKFLETARFEQGSGPISSSPQVPENQPE
jgi:pimeloyl-ACP methyl ester carboxylesterase